MMDERRIFHLSIPVSDLEKSKIFYTNVLGASVGRENEKWLDILLWGHQITLQLRPDEVLSIKGQGKRHFGVVLPWEVWESESKRISTTGVEFFSEPNILFGGTDEEQAKFYLSDPSNNVIEFKAYKNVSNTLKL